MKAKEMFKKLGYLEVKDKYIDGITYVSLMKNTYKEISMFKDGNKILIPIENIDILEYEELQAINKQVEELGWLGSEKE